MCIYDDIEDEVVIEPVSTEALKNAYNAVIAGAVLLFEEVREMADAVYGAAMAGDYLAMALANRTIYDEAESLVLQGTELAADEIYEELDKYAETFGRLVTETDHLIEARKAQLDQLAKDHPQEKGPDGTNDPWQVSMEGALRYLRETLSATELPDIGRASGEGYPHADH